jgi:hypothetical protein
MIWIPFAPAALGKGGQLALYGPVFPVISGCPPHAVEVSWVAGRGGCCRPRGGRCALRGRSSCDSKPPECDGREMSFNTTLHELASVVPLRFSVVDFPLVRTGTVHERPLHELYMLQIRRSDDVHSAAKQPTPGDISGATLRPAKKSAPSARPTSATRKRRA